MIAKKDINLLIQIFGADAEININGELIGYKKYSSKSELELSPIEEGICSVGMKFSNLPTLNTSLKNGTNNQELKTDNWESTTCSFLYILSLIHI